MSKPDILQSIADDQNLRLTCNNIDKVNKAMKYLSIRALCAKIRQIASAFRYLHSTNVVHRDVKSDNISLSRHMNAKLSDFVFHPATDNYATFGDPITMFELTRWFDWICSTGNITKSSL